MSSKELDVTLVVWKSAAIDPAPHALVTRVQSVQLKVTQLLHIVAKLSRLAPPAVGIGGSDQLRSWGSFWVAKTVF